MPNMGSERAFPGELTSHDGSEKASREPSCVSGAQREGEGAGEEHKAGGTRREGRRLGRAPEEVRGRGQGM